MSGGVDSSYLGYLCAQLKLRPLCVHFDNGWNSELAVANIEKMIRTYGFELRTYVIDWDEFRDLQRSFFKASVVDVELLTDHAIIASLNKIAVEENISFIFGGSNKACELLMPPLWNHTKLDALNIFAIQNEFGTMRIRNFPIIDPATETRMSKAGFRTVELLNSPLHRARGEGDARAGHRLDFLRLEAFRVGLYALLSGLLPAGEVRLRQAEGACLEPHLVGSDQPRRRTADDGGGVFIRQSRCRPTGSLY